jgi:hypothetical protein
MSDMELDKEQRNALHRIATLRLGSSDTIAIALERNDPDAALTERRILELIFRLLDDLGWNPDDQRRSFRLTMDRADRSLVLGELNDLAIGVLEADAAERRYVAEITEPDAITVLRATATLLHSPTR